MRTPDLLCQLYAIRSVNTSATSQNSPGHIQSWPETSTNISACFKQKALAMPADSVHLQLAQQVFYAECAQHSK
jgi:hypothetical protein